MNKPGLSIWDNNLGAFFTNIQIRIEDMNYNKVRDALIKHITELLQKEGFVPADSKNESEEIDRGIVIIPHSNKKWLGLYDEAIEDQNIKYLNKLTETISGELNTTAFNNLVHDSDVLCMSLFCRGKAIDSFNSAPNYWHKGKKKAGITGNPELWKGLLTDKSEISELKKIWKKDEIFAEDTLISCMKLFGIDFRYTTVGYSYLHYYDFEEKQCIYFKLREEFKKEKRAKGKPKIELAAYSPNPVKKSLHDNFSLASLSIKNSGGEGKGILIYIFGPAIDKNLIKPLNVILRRELPVTNKNRPVEWENIELSFKKKLGKDNKPLFITERNNYLLEAGFSPDSLKGLKPGQYMKIFREQISKNIGINIKIKAINTGKETLYIGFSPAENEKQGFCGHAVPIEISIPRWRPLYYKDGEHEQNYLVKLNEKNVLFLWLIFESIGQSNLVVIKETIKNFHEILNTHRMNKKYTILYIDENMHYQNPKEISLNSLFKSKFWQGIDTLIKPGIDLALTIQDRLDRAAGINITSGIRLKNQSFQTKDPKKLSTNLLFWLSLEKESRQIENALINAANILIKKNNIIQAFMDYWGDNPFAGYSTIYENACGINGLYADFEVYNKAFLRASAQDIWLGESLQKKIQENLVNRDFINTGQIGKALHIQLKDPAKMDDFEKLLAPVLPSLDQYKKMEGELK